MDRVVACPGSVPMSAGLESKSSVHAAEGTFAHGVGEQILKGQKPTVDPEMLHHVLIYTDYVRSLLGPGTALYVEKRVHVTKDVYGTADAIVWDPIDSTLYVNDLKYGVGVGVEVSDNLQLQTYALGAVLSTGHRPKSVVCTIIQPRYSHPDGPIRSKEYDIVDVLEFHSRLLDAIERVRDAEDTFGVMPDEEWQATFLNGTEKGCRWCLAAPNCPAMKRKASELASRVFSPLVAYDENELAHTLRNLPVLEGWIKNVREFAYQEAEAGRVPPGFKLVPKRASRKWRVEDEVATYLTAQGIDPWDKKLITITEAEKALGKKGALPDTLTVKESSGHTLVPDTDKREAVRVDAIGVFSGKSL